jgi:hypothetical protein
MLSRLKLRCNWLIAKSRLTAAKKDEGYARIELFFAEFEGVPDKGTFYSADKELKCVRKLTYTLDRDNDKITAALDRLTKEFPEVDVTEVIAWKASLDVKIYEAMPVEQQQILNDVLTIKPALVEITLIERDSD